MKELRVREQSVHQPEVFAELPKEVVIKLNAAKDEDARGENVKDEIAETEVEWGRNRIRRVGA